MGIRPNPAKAEITTKTVDRVIVHLITNRIEQNVLFYPIVASFGYIHLTRSSEIMRQHIREFIKALKEQLLKDWYVQS